MNILWVDDQVEVAGTFAELLKADCHLVEFACDGEVALQMIQSRSFDLILADLRMPPGEWGGLWLLHELKAICDVPPVIVVSGEGAQQETILALRLGAADYITKERIQNELAIQISAIANRLSMKRDIDTLIKFGEGQHTEFKSTLRYNLHSNKIDPALELAVLKTIAGFLNSMGGTLLIGVNDGGNVVGIEADKFPDSDKFQLHFWNLIREAIGAEVSHLLMTSVSSRLEGEVFQVDCRPSGKPIFLRWKAANESKAQELFYIRAGPQTEQLGTRQALTYIAEHFSRDRTEKS